jgi:hypothetical protein
LKTPVVRDAGDQLSKNPDGKEVSEEQFRHVPMKFLPEEVLIAGKDVREVQLYHA